MESPNVPRDPEAIAHRLHEPGEAAPSLKMNDVTFYLGRETLIVPPRQPGVARPPGSMPAWRAELFAVMSRNALSAATFFGLPPNRVSSSARRFRCSVAKDVQHRSEVFTAR